MKKILMVATYGDFFAAFEINNIKILNEMGYEVHLCANWTEEKYNYKHEKLQGLKYKRINIEFSRSPFATSNIEKYFQLSKLLSKEEYYLVDCHNAVVGVYARLAAKKNKVSKIMYTAHGFQFHKGGRIIDWLIYYPVESLLSRITDELVVINKEDFNVAKNMHAKNVSLIPGVGFRSKSKLGLSLSEIESKKKRLGLPPNSFIILSVGELSKRKNHKVIIRALSKIKNPNIYYLIAGQGKEYDLLLDFAIGLGLENHVKLLGHRSDIEELNAVSDIAAFPSKREGLGIAGLESLASGLPLISSNVQGIPDYSLHNVTGFVCNPNDSNTFSKYINILYQDEELRSKFRANTKRAVEGFDISVVEQKMKQIYIRILEG